MKMNKKSVFAGGAAVVLLLGSGITFARWYDEASIGTGDASVSSGQLSLDIENLSCTWASGAGTVQPGDTVVPGDTMECTGLSPASATLEGDNLEASLSVVPTGGAEDLLNDDFIDLTATVDGEQSVTLTEADNGRAFNVAFSVYFKEFRNSESNTSNESETPGTDTSQWWGQDKQGEQYNFAATDIKLQLVQNNR